MIGYMVYLVVYMVYMRMLVDGWWLMMASDS